MFIVLSNFLWCQHSYHDWFQAATHSLAHKIPGYPAVTLASRFISHFNTPLAGSFTCLWWSWPPVPWIYFLRFYLFIHERERERKRGRDTGRGRKRPLSGSPTWDSTSDPRITPRASKGRRSTAEPLRRPKDFIYLFMRDMERDREAETYAEGEAGSMQGTRYRTRSQDRGITP